jgi:hypothetical protein
MGQCKTIITLSDHTGKKIIKNTIQKCFLRSLNQQKEFINPITKGAKSVNTSSKGDRDALCLKVLQGRQPSNKSEEVPLQRQL